MCTDLGWAWGRCGSGGLRQATTVQGDQLQRCCSGDTGLLEIRVPVDATRGTMLSVAVGFGGGERRPWPHIKRGGVSRIGAPADSLWEALAVPLAMQGRATQGAQVHAALCSTVGVRGRARGSAQGTSVCRAKTRTRVARCGWIVLFCAGMQSRMPRVGALLKLEALAVLFASQGVAPTRAQAGAAHGEASHVAAGLLSTP